MGSWLEQRRSDKAIPGKIRDDAEIRSLSGQKLTRRKDKWHGDIWLSEGTWI